MALSIHEAKAKFYSYTQSNLTNYQHLQQFKILDDITTPYYRNLHYKTITNYFTQQKNSNKSNYITSEQLNWCEDYAKQMYLAISSLQRSKNGYRKQVENLENYHTKGNNNYPQYILNAYQLLNKFKQFKPRHGQIPQAMGVTFQQYQKHIHQTKNNENNGDNNEKLLYKCVKKDNKSHGGISCIKERKTGTSNDEYGYNINSSSQKKVKFKSKVKLKDKSLVTVSQEEDDVEEYSYSILFNDYIYIVTVITTKDL